MKNPTRRSGREGELQTLEPRVSDFLGAFARSLQRYSMYPTGHPALRTAGRNLVDQLVGLVGQRGHLEIGVARDHLVVEGRASGPENLLLAGLARRLHRHQILSLTLESRILPEEMTELLGRLAVEPGPDVQALGASNVELQEHWPHILVEPVPYESLSLSDTEPTEAAPQPQLWGRDPFADTDAAQHAATAAERLRTSRAREQAAYKSLVDEFVSHLTEIASDPDEEEHSLRKGVSRLIVSLGPKKLRRLLTMARTPEADGDAGVDGQGAVGALAWAAGQGAGENLSTWLVRLLTKLATRAEFGDDVSEESESDEVLAELVEQLAGSHPISESTPDDYSELLRQLFKQTPVLPVDRKWVQQPRPSRVVMMSIEMDDAEDAATGSAATMLEAGEIGPLLDLLENPPPGNGVARRLWGPVAQPETVARLLMDDPPDFQTLDRLIPYVGLPAAEPMLQVLSDSESRSTRRELFNRLVDLGEGIGPRVVDRLRDPRWFVRRNMLALLERFDRWPAEFNPAPYLDDDEHRVRREAVKLALRVPEQRERAMSLALADSDVRTIVTALTAAADGCPPALVPDILEHALDADMPPAARVRALRALAGLRSQEVRDALLEITWTRRFLFWGTVAPPNPMTLEALAVLARDWGDDRRARRVLKRALRSDDPRVKAAARGEVAEG